MKPLEATSVHNEQYAVFVNLSIYTPAHTLLSPVTAEMTSGTEFVPSRPREGYVNLYLWSEVMSPSLFYKIQYTSDYRLVKVLKVYVNPTQAFFYTSGIKEYL